MEFAISQLLKFKDSGKEVCIYSDKIYSLIKDYTPKDFCKFSTRSFYFWKNKQRPIPLSVVLNLMKSNRIKSIEINSFSVNSGNKIFLPDDKLISFHYLLGLILGDGCLVVSKKIPNRQTYLLQITFRTKTEAIVVGKMVKNLFRIKSSIYPGEGCYNLAVHSKPLVLMFHIKYEIPIGLKYKYIKVPRRVFMGTEPEKIAFVKGVFDSDGNIYNYRGKKGVQLRQKSGRFLLELRKLFLEMGVNFNNPYRDKANNSWVLWSSKRELVDTFINKINALNIDAPVAQPG